MEQSVVETNDRERVKPLQDDLKRDCAGHLGCPDHVKLTSRLVASLGADERASEGSS